MAILLPTQELLLFSSTVDGLGDPSEAGSSKVTSTAHPFSGGTKVVNDLSRASEMSILPGETEVCRFLTENDD